MIYGLFPKGLIESLHTSCLSLLSTNKIWDSIFLHMKYFFHHNVHFSYFNWSMYNFNTQSRITEVFSTWIFCSARDKCEVWRPSFYALWHCVTVCGNLELQHIVLTFCISCGHLVDCSVHAEHYVLSDTLSPYWLKIGKDGLNVASVWPPCDLEERRLFMDFGNRLVQQIRVLQNIYGALNNRCF